MEALVIWLMGLSGSGKSTIALGLEKELKALGHPVFVLDGDDLRKGLSSDLGFSQEERRENIRRAAQVANLFLKAGFSVIAAFISPYEDHRKLAKQILKHRTFIEVYLDCPLELCQKRDPKGLYAKAKGGEIQNLSAWDAPFEAPKNPNIVLESGKLSIDECIQKILKHVQQAVRASKGGGL